ncbi:uncharacterized protein VNE69_09151 [Vairimorpha necatrix]|uniref:Uncharacterized protein n=1 Tax=Vairimorpha necatrix TaxID=6039 RepID=A0AAX4JFG3_9MICR
MSPPYESRKYKVIISRIKYVTDDILLRKKEYRSVLSEYTILSVFDERNEKSKEVKNSAIKKDKKSQEIEHSINEDYNIVEAPKYQSKDLKNKQFNKRLSLDLFTPLVLLNKDLYSLLLLILRLFPVFRLDFLCFFFLFLYILDFKILSLVVSLFCDYSNIKNISSRLITTVLIYYLLFINQL